mgnify:CR=1 FL=1
MWWGQGWRPCMRRWRRRLAAAAGHSLALPCLTNVPLHRTALPLPRRPSWSPRCTRRASRSACHSRRWPPTWRRACRCGARPEGGRCRRRMHMSPASPPAATCWPPAPPSREKALPTPTIASVPPPLNQPSIRTPFSSFVSTPPCSRALLADHPPPRLLSSSAPARAGDPLQRRRRRGAGRHRRGGGAGGLWRLHPALLCLPLHRR